ncbi:MAG: hypothetical protein JWR38_3135 [Mucilaginibacter sp.]|nr:hypothetical protein [Mucilaginibacter sp.]
MLRKDSMLVKTHPDISASRRIVDPLFGFAGKRVKENIICHAERSEASIKRHKYSRIDPSFLRMTNSFIFYPFVLCQFSNSLFPPQAKRGWSIRRLAEMTG